jgi:hypothetical protein
MGAAGLLKEAKQEEREKENERERQSHTRELE